MARASWSPQAECHRRDLPVEVFVPECENAASTAVAKRVCGVCPVRAACLADALADGVEHGVWGGLDSRERRAMRRVHGGKRLVNGRLCAGAAVVEPAGRTRRPTPAPAAGVVELPLAS